ncbi:MAG TPA: hypothetical protein VFZ59_15370 [Verrucomicrobiae bacterium]|nr:hypothetical protein [Verrucomicrobiae bacterium]
MSVELQVIRASEFIRLNADKYLDLAASKEALRTLAMACRKRGLDCALMDLRPLPLQAKPHFNTEELAALVGAFRDGGFSRKQRLAIVYRHDVHGGIRSFAFIGRMRGLQVHAFSEYDEAMEWLAGESTGKDTIRERGAAIPIKQSQSEMRRVPIRTRTPQPVRRMRMSSPGR